MIDALATNHTSFLREPDHFDFFRQQRHSRSGRAATQLEIWCAACSTGEEVWTLGLVLNEAVLPAAIPYRSQRHLEQSACSCAQAGEYSAERAPALPAAWLRRYFDRVQRPDAAYQVSAASATQAAFRRINLVEHLPWQRQFPGHLLPQRDDLFRPQTQEDVVRRLAALPGTRRLSLHRTRGKPGAGIATRWNMCSPRVYRKPGKEGRMEQIVVGMADCRVGRVAGQSACDLCPGLLHRSRRSTTRRPRVGGLLHFMLPDSAIDPQRARRIRSSSPIPEFPVC